MSMEGHDRTCHFCKQKCNALAEDPRLWPCALYYPDEDVQDIKWHHSACVMGRLVELEQLRKENEELVKPVPMYLTCPKCHERHIDEGEFATKPHHTHACQSCGLVWRPALVPTVGVEFLPGFNNAESAEGCKTAKPPIGSIVRRADRKRIAESIGRWAKAKTRYVHEEDDAKGAVLMIVGDLMNGEWEEDTLGGTVEGNP